MLTLSHPLLHSLHTVPFDGGTGRLGEGTGLNHGVLHGKGKVESAVQRSLWGSLGPQGKPLDGSPGLDEPQCYQIQA